MTGHGDKFMVTCPKAGCGNEYCTKCDPTCPALCMEHRGHAADTQALNADLLAVAKGVHAMLSYQRETFSELTEIDAKLLRDAAEAIAQAGEAS